MKPFEKDELTDRELDGLLPQWKAPDAPARLRAKVFPGSWWQRVWGTSIRVPVPVACAMAVVLVLVIGAVGWARPVPAPRVMVRTERVEVPVVQVRVVYRDRPITLPIAWRPVRELSPRIIRGPNDQK